MKIFRCRFRPPLSGLRRLADDKKTDAGREKRIAWIVDRLNKNLKPM